MRRSHEKSRALVFLAVAAGFVSSCRSTPEGYSRAPAGNTLSVALAQMERGCALTKGEGNFLAVLSAEGIPAMQFEGAWSAGFSRLRADILSPLGEALASLQLQDQGDRTQVQVSGAGGQDVQDIAAFLELIGSRNLRLLSCGLHLRGEVFVNVAHVPESMSFHHNYLSRGELEAQGSTLSVRSEVLAFRKGEPSIISARSRISGGLFSKSEIGVVHWNGEVSARGLFPKEVRALFPSASVTLIFSEFE